MNDVCGYKLTYTGEYGETGKPFTETLTCSLAADHDLYHSDHGVIFGPRREPHEPRERESER